MGSSDDENTEADQSDAGPAKGRDVLTEDKIAQDGHRGISEGRGGLHVAVVGPGEEEHVHEKKTEKTGDAEPEGWGKESVVEERKKIDEAVRIRSADVFHAFAKENVAEGAEKDAEENEWNGLQLQAPSVFMVISQWSSWASLRE